MSTTHAALSAPRRPKRAPILLPALLVFLLPVLGGLVLLPHTSKPPHSAPAIAGQSSAPGPWYGRQRAELAADLKGRVRLGMDKDAVRKQLGHPDWIRMMSASRPSEMWSYWCRDTRQHFLFVNGQLQSEETLPYPAQ